MILMAILKLISLERELILSTMPQIKFITSNKTMTVTEEMHIDRTRAGLNKAAYLVSKYLNAQSRLRPHLKRHHMSKTPPISLTHQTNKA